MGRKAAKQKAAVPVVWKCELAAFHTFHAKPPESHPTLSSGIAITAQPPGLDLALPWGTRPFLVPGTDILLIMQSFADGASKKCFSSLFASPSKSSQGAQTILCGQLASSRVT